MECKRAQRLAMTVMMGFAAVLPFCCVSVLAAPAIEAYGHLPGIEGVKLSPSGEHIAMVGVVNEQRRLLILKSDGTLLKAGAVGDSKIRDLYWAGDEHVLLITSATVDLTLDFGHTYELDSVIHVGLDDKKPWIVFDHVRSISHTVLGYYGSAKQDGHWYGFFGGITQARSLGDNLVFDHGYADLYRVDLDTGKTSLQAKGSEQGHYWVLAADGGVLAHTSYNASSGEWRLFAGAQDGTSLLRKISPTNDIYVFGAGRSSGTVTVVDRSGEEYVLEEINISDGKAEKLFDHERVACCLFDPVTHLLLGANALDGSGAKFFDPNLQSRFNGTRKAFPGLHVHLESYSQNLDRMIVETDGAHDSGTFWSVNITSGKADPIGYAYPEIKSADVGVSKQITYHAGDGMVIEGILTLPPGREAKGLPLVVLPHGGPLDVRDVPGFDWWAQAFASQGYAVLQPNYRGSSGYGAEFRRAGFGQWGRKMLSDISDGITELATQQVVDPKRVCIMGASYGGYAALAGVTLQHGLYRCAVSVSGPANLQSFGVWQASLYGYDTAHMHHWRKVTGADTEGDGVLRAISPAFAADKADAPILLIHGKDDTRVPIEQSEQMAAALKHADKPYQFVILPREDHFLSREVTRTAMLKAAVSFVEKYNPPL